MNDINHSCEEENVRLHDQIEYLECELTAASEERQKLIRDTEKISKENGELRGKVRFLEGQIEAYQYCMNCRR